MVGVKLGLGGMRGLGRGGIVVVGGKVGAVVVGVGS